MSATPLRARPTARSSSGRCGPRGFAGSTALLPLSSFCVCTPHVCRPSCLFTVPGASPHAATAASSMLLRAAVKMRGTDHALPVCSAASYACIGLSAGALMRPLPRCMQIDRGNAVVRTLRQDGGQSVMAAAWSPQGTPLVTADKAGLVTFWSPKAEQQPQRPQQQAPQPASPQPSQPQQHRPQQQQPHRGHQSHARHTR